MVVWSRTSVGRGMVVSALALGLGGCLAEGRLPCAGASCLSEVQYIYASSTDRPAPVAIPLTFAGRGASTTLVAWVEVAESDERSRPTTSLLQLDRYGHPVGAPISVDGEYQWHTAVPGGFWVRTSARGVLVFDTHGRVRALGGDLFESTPAWVGSRVYFPVDEWLAAHDAEGHLDGWVRGDRSTPELVSDATFRGALAWGAADGLLRFRTLRIDGVLSEATEVQLDDQAYTPASRPGQGPMVTTCGESCWLVVISERSARLVVRARDDGPPIVQRTPLVATGTYARNTWVAATSGSHDVLVEWPTPDHLCALSWTRRGIPERVGWLESWPTVAPLDEHRFVVVTTSVTAAGDGTLSLRVLGD